MKLHNATVKLAGRTENACRAKSESFSFYVTVKLIRLVNVSHKRYVYESYKRLIRYTFV